MEIYGDIRMSCIFLLRIWCGFFTTWPYMILGNGILPNFVLWFLCIVSHSKTILATFSECPSGRHKRSMFGCAAGPVDANHLHPYLFLELSIPGRFGAKISKIAVVVSKKYEVFACSLLEDCSVWSTFKIIRSFNMYVAAAGSPEVYTLSNDRQSCFLI